VQVVPDKTYILRFKSPEPSIRTIVASTAGIYGDHLILLNSEGLLAALFVSETVESWNEI
jgi:hypothetical protein